MIASFALFDGLIRLEFRYHRKHWEKDGSPIGFLWVPPEASVWLGTRARNRCLRKWVHCTPAWVRKDNRAQRILFWYRFALGFAMLGLPSFVLSVLIQDVLR